MTDLREQLAKVIAKQRHSENCQDEWWTDDCDVRMADAIIAAGLAPQWRPIETAPIWEMVITYTPDHCGTKSTMENKGVIASVQVELGVWGLGRSSDRTPTRWMPLPAAPGVQGGEA